MVGTKPKPQEVPRPAWQDISKDGWSAGIRIHPEVHRAIRVRAATENIGREHLVHNILCDAFGLDHLLIGPTRATA